MEWIYQALFSHMSQNVLDFRAKRKTLGSNIPRHMYFPPTRETHCDKEIGKNRTT